MLDVAPDSKKQPGVKSPAKRDSSSAASEVMETPPDKKRRTAKAKDTPEKSAASKPPPALTPEGVADEKAPENLWSDEDAPLVPAAGTADDVQLVDDGQAVDEAGAEGKEATETEEAAEKVETGDDIALTEGAELLPSCREAKLYLDTLEGVDVLILAPSSVVPSCGFVVWQNNSCCSSCTVPLSQRAGFLAENISLIFGGIKRRPEA